LFTRTKDAAALVVMGYDLGSSPTRLTALERARDTGAAAVTERITLVGRVARPGFIIFFPVYDPDKPRSTPADRRAAAKGFVQAIFSLDELIAAALGGTAPQGLPFELLDVSAPEANRSIFRWSARLPPAASWKTFLHPQGIHLTETLSFAGRDWAIDVAPNSTYLEDRYPLAHWAILPIGWLLTALLAAYLYVVLSRREELARLFAELRKAHDEIKTLEGILPICASCKKIRDENSTWVQVEDYVSRHTGAEFSHGICPDCMKALYPDIAQRLARRDPQAG
jgi:CHASE1-domain containing sensor protein